MAEVVGIRFRKNGKIYDFDPQSFELKSGDLVVVETARGLELGEVIVPKHNGEQAPDTVIKPVVRLAEKADVEKAESLSIKEGEALKECDNLVARLELPMKLISAEYNLDASHLTIYFSAENRVDFRELVRELSHNLKVRVELRQIGPRDEAKLLGGYGRCGLELCCASFLTEFNPVSIKMAKVQDLPLNPLKISGVCGRLLCCLGYECEQYRQMKEKMPREGTRVMTDAGPGLVVGGNPLTEKVLIEYETGARLEIPVSRIKLMKESTQPSSLKAASTSVGNIQDIAEPQAVKENDKTQEGNGRPSV